MINVMFFKECAMRKKLCSILFVLTIFSSQSIASPLSETFMDLVPSSLRSDQHFIDTLNEIIESDGARKLTDEDHQYLVSRIVSSELANDDILSRLIEAIKLSEVNLSAEDHIEAEKRSSQGLLLKPIQTINKYLLQVLDSEKAGVKTSESILEFIETNRIGIFDDNHLIVKKVIAKHKGLNNRVLTSAVGAVLASKIPLRDEVKSDVVASVINELRGSYKYLCITLHVLEEHATSKEQFAQSEHYVGVTSMYNDTREDLIKMVLRYMNEHSENKEANACPTNFYEERERLNRMALKEIGVSND